jgi:S1-C subfamily serine protease
MRNNKGVLVASVLAGAGRSADVLAPGDVIYRLNREPVDSLEALRKLLDGSPVERSVVLQVERGGRLRYVELILD